MNSKAVSIGLAAVIIAAGGIQGLAGGQAKTQAELRKPFVGTWRLVTIEGGPQSGPQSVPANRGRKPTGLIMYDQHGNMAVQIMPDRARPKWTGVPTPEQAVDAIRGYTAYFGTYTIDEKARTVTHHRQGMLDGGVVDFVRKFELTADGNRVVLTPISGGTVYPPSPTRLTWERVR